MIGKIKVAAPLMFFIVLIPSVHGFAGRSHKPLPPLEIHIAPVKPEIVSTQIKPGEIIEFKIRAMPFLDMAQMSIQVDLIGGVTLISGVTSWSGQGVKNREKVLFLTVKAPERGKGKLVASVRTVSASGTRFSAEAQYVLGPKGKEKAGRNEHPVKKDRRGRDVIEYR